MNKSKKKRGRSLPKSPRPADGVALSNIPKYLVTPLGVYSLGLNRFLKGCKGSKGYLQVWLICADGVRRWFAIHRLIAEAHVPNPHNLPIAHHCDHQKLNNNASNLKWVSHRENIQLAAAAGRMSGKKTVNGPHHMLGKKLSVETRQRMSESRSGLKNPRCQGPYYLGGVRAESLKELSQLTGVPMSQIKRLNRTKLKQPGMKLPRQWREGLMRTSSSPIAARRQ